MKTIANREVIDTVRFWDKVNGLAGEGCWTWQAMKLRQGYGVFRVNKRQTMLAHRISFFLATGVQPQQVCHLCDNPSCVNPDHLVAGDLQVNYADMLWKGRGPRQTGAWIQGRGEKSGFHKLTEAKVVEIRSLAGHLSQYKIGRKFKISQTMVSAIIRRKYWTHI